MGQTKEVVSMNKKDIIDVLEELAKEIRKEGLSYTGFDKGDRTYKEFHGLMEAERIVQRKIRKYLREEDQ